MLDRFEASLARPLALASVLSLGACESEVENSIPQIRAQACLAAFQEGDDEQETQFTATAEDRLAPYLGQNREGELSGYNQAWYLDSTYGPQTEVNVRDQLASGLVGVAYEGRSPWAADATEAWEVALSTENPTHGEWPDLEQGLYSSVDLTSDGAEAFDSSNSYWNDSRLVSVSLFTDNCEEIVSSLDGQVASTVEVSPDGVAYAQ